MCSSSVFTCIMTVISIWYLGYFKYIFKLFFTNISLQHIFAFLYDYCCSFVNDFMFIFVKCIFFIVCSRKDLQNFFMQSRPLYTSCLFFMSLNDDIVDIEKPDEICSLTFVLDELSGLFIYPSMFSIKH